MCIRDRYIDGAIAALDMAPESGSAYAKTSASALAIGSHSWYVNCTDSANNTNSTAARALSIIALSVPSNPPSGGNGGGSNSNGGGNVFIPASAPPALAPEAAPAPAPPAAPAETPTSAPAVNANAAQATVAQPTAAPRLEIPAPAAESTATPPAAAALFGIELSQLVAPVAMLGIVAVFAVAMSYIFVFRHKK